MKERIPRRSLLRLDLRRAFGSIGMKIALIISTVIVIYHVIYTVRVYGPVWPESLLFPEYPISLYRVWIGGERFSFASALLFYMLPLLAALAYGSSYYDDRKNGYLKHLCLQRAKVEIVVSRAISNFAAAFCTVIFPYILDLMLLSLFYPALRPEITTQDFLADNSFMIDIYLAHPLIYCLIYLAIMGVLFGAVSCFSLAASFYMKYRTLVVATPFIIWFFVILFLSSVPRRWAQIDVFFHPTQYAAPNAAILFTYVMLMLFLSVPLFIYKGIKSEPY